jgi:integrase
LKDWRRKYEYGVTRGEVQAFIDGNLCVRQFLAKYSEASKYNFSRYLCMFFKWLRLRKSLELEPAEFLQLLSEKRQAVSVEDRCWGRNLVLEFTRDNPDLKGKSHSLLYGAMFKSVNLFCKAHEVDLTSARGVYGEKKRRKYRPAPYTVALAKKVLAVVNQRDRAICMLGLQTGQSVKQVLDDINSQYDYIVRMINQGKRRIRFDFAERKRNGFQYYTFCSLDAITELQKWLPIRKRWLGSRKSPCLFIKRNGDKLTPDAWKSPFRERLQRHGIYKGPYSVIFHMFRKIFESEASPPDRGISKDYVRFMMGHAVDDINGDQLDIPGGTYDQAPFTHPDVVEREYSKLEPYLNIFSQRASEDPDLALKMKFAETFTRYFEENPGKEEKFQEFLKRL